MATMEQIEMSRYHHELAEDVQHMVRKYCRIMAWDVPELDESVARRMILDALREALANVEHQGAA